MTTHSYRHAIHLGMLLGGLLVLCAYARIGAL